MPGAHVPLNEVAVEIQNAVERILGKHGAVPVDKLWVGFVAPENVATQENANKLAAEIGKEAGIKGEGGIAQLGAGPAQEHAKAIKPVHIIGLVFNPAVSK